MAGVRAGDLVEMTDSHFRKFRTMLDGGAAIRREEKNVRMEHTAVIVGVVADRIEVVEQNAGVEKNIYTYHMI